MSADILPARVSLPNTITYRIFRWAQITFFACLIGGFVAMFAVAGQWLGVAIFAPVLLMILFYGWLALTERLELHELGFDYSVGSRKWQCRWSECAGFRSHEDWWRGVRWVNISWATPRPEFTLGQSSPANEARLFSTFGMAARDLAALMDRFRARALGAER